MSEFKDAVASGEIRVQLQAIRDQLASKMDAGVCKYCGGPKGETAGMASIARELRQVLNDLQALPNSLEVSTIDRLLGERLSRTSESEDTPYSGKGAARRQGGRRPGGGRRIGS